MEIDNILWYDMNWIDDVCPIHICRKNSRILKPLLKMLLESIKKELSEHGE